MVRNEQLIVNTAVEYSFLANTITDIFQPQVIFLSGDMVLSHCSVDINKKYSFESISDAIGKSKLVHFWKPASNLDSFNTDCDSIVVRDLGSNNSVRFKRQKLGRFQNDLLMIGYVEADRDPYQAFIDNLTRIIRKDKSISVTLGVKGSEPAMLDTSDEPSDTTLKSDYDDSDTVNHAKGELSGGGYSISGTDDDLKQTSDVFVDEPLFSRLQFLNIKNEYGLYDVSKSEQTFQLEYLLFLFNYRASLQNVVLDRDKIEALAKSKNNPYSEFVDYFDKQKNKVLGVLAGQIFFMVNDIFKNSKIVILTSGSGCLSIDILTSKSVSEHIQTSRFGKEFVGANFTGASTFPNWLMWRFGITIPDSLIKRFYVNVPGFKPIKDVRKWLDDFGSNITGDVRNPRKDVPFGLALLLGLNLATIRRHLLCDIAALFNGSRYDFWAILLSNCMHLWFLKVVKNIKITNVAENINTANFTNFVLVPGIYRHGEDNFLGLIPCVLSSEGQESSLSIRLNGKDYYLHPSALTGVTGVTSESFLADVKEYLQHDTIVISSLGVEIRSETLASNQAGYIAGYEYIAGLLSKYRFGLICPVDSYGVKVLGSAAGVNNDVLEINLDAQYYFKIEQGTDSGLTSSYQNQTEQASGNDQTRANYTSDYNTAEFTKAKELSDKYANTPWDSFVQNEQAIQQAVQSLFSSKLPVYSTEDAGGVQYISQPQEVYYTND